MSGIGGKDQPVDAGDTGAERNDSDLVTDFAVSHLSVAPGSSVPISIPVTNTGEIIDGITAIVDGVDPDWVRLERPVVSIFPDETGVVDVWFDAPRDCPAGDYLVTIRLVSTIEPERQSVHDFWLTVLAVPALSLTLTPQVVTGGTVGRSSASVTNTGNASANVRVTALDPSRDVDVVVDPGAFILPAGDTALVDIHMRGRRPWFGQPDARTIAVTARVADVEVERNATFNQRPRISRGVITMIILALIILLWALIFLFAVNALRQSDPVAKATATSFAEGQSEIPLALIAASADGTITASTTGNGVARVTVEAYRLTADDTLEASGSAATNEDGTYALPSLLPGTYLFRASGDGFAEVWFPQSPDAAGAERVRLDPKVDANDLDIEMTGELGRIVGSIALPPNTPEVELTVTATQKLERTDAGGAAAGGDASAGGTNADAANGEGGATAAAVPFSTMTTTTDGTIDIDGLPTPGTYQVTVTGDGFATVDFDQEVGGGDVTVINTVTAAAAAGEISGVVRNQSGTPTGDVTVTIRSGDFVASATTPTSGATGSYRFIGLATPATYTLEFTAPRFRSSSLALELDPGEVAAGVDAQIIGGSGTITGLARSADGLPVGGLTVEVVGVGFRQETATLTSSGAGGAAGSFSMTNIPVPGTYTVTLSGDGFQTETLDAAFLAAGTQAVGDVVMVPVLSELSGTVLAGGSGAGAGLGVGQATVTLSNGVRDFVTISASNPVGRYSFAAVADGTYTVTVEQNGFEPRVVLVRVDGGVDLVRNVTIQPEATP